MEAVLTWIKEYWPILAAIAGASVAFYRRLVRVERAANRHKVYDESFEALNEGMFAVLDGLHQLGCNGEVTKAREEFMHKRSKV